MRPTDILTSLQEDFAAIGETYDLEDESDLEVGDELEFSEAEEGDEDEYLADGEEEYEDAEEGDEYQLSAEEVAQVQSVTLKSQSLNEKMGSRGGKGRMHARMGMQKTHRVGAAEKMSRHRDYMHNKAHVLSQQRKRMKTGHAIRLAKIHHDKLAQKGGARHGFRLRTAPMSSGLDQISTLAEEVKSLAMENAQLEQTSVLRSFAEMALISDQLCRAFTLFGERLEDQELVDLSVKFGEMAEDNSDIVEALQRANFSISREDLTSSFNADMDCLQDGLNVYDELKGLLSEDSEEEVQESGGRFLSGKRAMSGKENQATDATGSGSLNPRGGHSLSFPNRKKDAAGNFVKTYGGKPRGAQRNSTSDATGSRSLDATSTRSGGLKFTDRKKDAKGNFVRTYGGKPRP